MGQQQQALRREYTYTIVLTPDEEEGGYLVTVPALPGCITDGDDIEEAREHAAEAIAGYLEALLADGEAIPPDTDSAASGRRESVTVRAPGQ